MEVVVEDIESIDFDRFEKHDKKLKDWRFGKEWDLCEERIQFTSRKNFLLTYFNVPKFDAPELLLSGEETRLMEAAYQSVSVKLLKIIPLIFGFFRLQGINTALATTRIWEIKTFSSKPKALCDLHLGCNLLIHVA